MRIRIIDNYLKESTSTEITNYLKSNGLIDMLDTSDSKACCEKVVSLCKELFENIVLPEIVSVQVLKVTDDKSYDVVENGYYVVKYNGKFFDYCASDYFSDIFDVYAIPVIQPVLNTPRLIHSTVSTVKSYVLIAK
jgi:hypothetical protein